MKYLIFAAGLCLTACNNKTVPAEEDSIIHARDTAITVEETDWAVDTFARITFPECKVIIHPIVVDREEQQRLDQPPQDTTFMMSEIGQSMQGVFITIFSDQLTDIKIEEKIETSMAISTEDGLYMLSDWKHGYSEWEELGKNERGVFVAKEYMIEESSIFPEVTLNEFKAAVKAAGGEEMMIENVKTMKDEQLQVFADRYFLRVSGKRKTDGTIFTRIIVIALPLG